MFLSDDDNNLRAFLRLFDFDDKQELLRYYRRQFALAIERGFA